MTSLLSRGVCHFVGLLFLMCPFLVGCNSPWGYVAGAAAVTAVAARSPANEIEQVYYLGVFDPQEQVPPAVYRVTVHGQAGVISRTKFASGWVPANIVDTLNESIGYDENGNFTVQSKPSDAEPARPAPEAKPAAPDAEKLPPGGTTDKPADKDGAKKKDARDPAAPPGAPAAALDKKEPGGSIDKSAAKDEAKTPDAGVPATPPPSEPGAPVLPDAKKSSDDKKPETDQPRAPDVQSGKQGAKKVDALAQPTPGTPLNARAGNKGLPTGRRMIMFGPEGFREAPRDHRLVIVMGTNPEAYFKAIGDSMEQIRVEKAGAADNAASQAILREKLRIESEYARLTDLRDQLARSAAR